MYLSNWFTHTTYRTNSVFFHPLSCFKGLTVAEHELFMGTRKTNHLERNGIRLQRIFLQAVVANLAASCVIPSLAILISSTLLGPGAFCDGGNAYGNPDKSRQYPCIRMWTATSHKGVSASCTDINLFPNEGKHAQINVLDLLCTSANYI